MLQHQAVELLFQSQRSLQQVLVGDATRLALFPLRCQDGLTVGFGLLSQQ
jgi:hypothetical protein